jgi:hypothetical protein
VSDKSLVPEASTLSADTAPMVIVSGLLSLSNVRRNCAILTTKVLDVSALETTAKSCGSTVPSALTSEPLIVPTVIRQLLK